MKAFYHTEKFWFDGSILADLKTSCCRNQLIFLKTVSQTPIANRMREKKTVGSSCEKNFWAAPNLHSGIAGTVLYTIDDLIYSEETSAN